MIRVISLWLMVLWPFAYLHADVVAPWADGQDLDQFYDQYCSAPDLEKHYFPSLDTRQLEGLTHLLSELLWADNSDNLLGVPGSGTTAVVARLRALQLPIAPAFTMMVQQAVEEPTHSKYVHLNNVNLKQRRQAFEDFERLVKSNAELAGAMLTVIHCRIVRNVKTVDPFVARRVAQVNAMKLTIKTDTAGSPEASALGGYSDPDCGCGGGNFCYGPRGGHYCITSGGNKRYVKH